MNGTGTYDTDGRWRVDPQDRCLERSAWRSPNTLAAEGDPRGQYGTTYGSFWSRKLSSTESRYPAYDRALLAIREAILNWRYYLHGATFTVYTDHAALQRILTQRTMSIRQITNFEGLQGYDF
jgi:hypothetical protein